MGQNHFTINFPLKTARRCKVAGRAAAVINA